MRCHDPPLPLFPLLPPPPASSPHRHSLINAPVLVNPPASRFPVTKLPRSLNLYAPIVPESKSKRCVENRISCCFAFKIDLLSHESVIYL